jgi:hypothetical protein
MFKVFRSLRYRIHNPIISRSLTRLAFNTSRPIFPPPSARARARAHTRPLSPPQKFTQLHRTLSSSSVGSSATDIVTWLMVWYVGALSCGVLLTIIMTPFEQLYNERQRKLYKLYWAAYDELERERVERIRTFNKEISDAIIPIDEIKLNALMLELPKFDEKNCQGKYACSEKHPFMHLLGEAFKQNDSKINEIIQRSISHSWYYAEFAHDKREEIRNAFGKNLDFYTRIIIPLEKEKEKIDEEYARNYYS